MSENLRGGAAASASGRTASSDVAASTSGGVVSGRAASDYAAPDGVPVSSCCDSPAGGDNRANEAAAAPATGASTVTNASAAPEACCCGNPRYKNTERANELQSDLQKRLNRAIGQLNGIKRMVDDNRYCGDILTQLAAAEAAVHRVSEIILRNHLETCVVERVQQGDTQVLDEVMDLIRKFSK